MTIALISGVLSNIKNINEAQQIVDIHRSRFTTRTNRREWLDADPVEPVKPAFLESRFTGHQTVLGTQPGKRGQDKKGASGTAIFIRSQITAAPGGKPAVVQTSAYLILYCGAVDSPEAPAMGPGQLGHLARAPCSTLTEAHPTSGLAKHDGHELTNRTPV